MTLSSSSPKTLRPERAVSASRRRAGSARAAWRAWKACRLATYWRFSASVERTSSRGAGGAPASGASKVLTPTIGSSPECFNDS